MISKRIGATPATAGGGVPGAWALGSVPFGDGVGGLTEDAGVFWYDDPTDTLYVPRIALDTAAASSGNRINIGTAGPVVAGWDGAIQILTDNINGGAFTAKNTLSNKGSSVAVLNDVDVRCAMYVGGSATGYANKGLLFTAKDGAGVPAGLVLANLGGAGTIEFAPAGATTAQFATTGHLQMYNAYRMGWLSEYLQRAAAGTIECFSIFQAPADIVCIQNNFVVETSSAWGAWARALLWVRDELGTNLFQFGGYDPASGSSLTYFYGGDAWNQATIKITPYSAASPGVGIMLAGATLPSSALDVNGNIEVGAGDAFYFGDPSTDGSWRIVRSGNNLVFERREVGVWVTKQTMTP